MIDDTAFRFFADEGNYRRARLLKEALEDFHSEVERRFQKRLMERIQSKTEGSELHRWEPTFPRGGGEVNFGLRPPSSREQLGTCYSVVFGYNEGKGLEGQRTDYWLGVMFDPAARGADRKRAHEALAHCILEPACEDPTEGYWLEYEYFRSWPREGAEGNVAAFAGKVGERLVEEIVGQVVALAREVDKFLRKS